METSFITKGFGPKSCPQFSIVLQFTCVSRFTTKYDVFTSFVMIRNRHFHVEYIWIPSRHTPFMKRCGVTYPHAGRFFTLDHHTHQIGFQKTPTFCHWTKIRSDIPGNLKSFPPYSFAKQYKNVLLSRQNSCWFSFCMLVTFCNIVLMPLFTLLSFSSTVARPTFPLYTGMLFSTVFIVVLLLILPDVDLMLYYYFFATCKTSLNKM